MIAITPESGGQPILFDAVVQSTRTKDVDVTEHPVEQGTNVADHVRPKAEELRIDAIIADFPLPGTAAGLLYGRGEDGRAEDLYSRIEGFRDGGTTLRIDTKGKTYDNMVIQSMARTDNKDAADAIHCTLMLKEIRIVSTQTVPLTKPKITAAVAKANTGKQAGQAAGADKRQSTLAKGDDLRKDIASGDTAKLVKSYISKGFGSH